MCERLDDLAFADDIALLSHTDTNAGEDGQTLRSCSNTWSYTQYSSVDQRRDRQRQLYFLRYCQCNKSFLIKKSIRVFY